MTSLRDDVSYSWSFMAVMLSILLLDDLGFFLRPFFFLSPPIFFFFF